MPRLRSLVDLEETVMGVGEAQQRAAAMLAKLEDSRKIVRRGGSASYKPVTARVGVGEAEQLARDVLALVKENKELLGGLYLTKHNLEKAEARVAELAAALADLDGTFAWLEEHYPKALREMPTELFRRFGRAQVALAGVPVAEEETK